MLDRRVLGGLPVLVATGCESDGFLVAFTERHPGRSRPPFDTLNLSFATGDEPDRVAGNRETVCGALGVESFAVGQQVHGADVAEVDSTAIGAGFRHPDGAFPATDALATGRRGVALAVLVADCVPVAMAAPRTGRVAVVHAGWRGIAAGVVQRALNGFAGATDLRAAIGPAIGPDHYEVGADVIDALEAAGPVRVAGRTAGGRRLVDLSSTVEAILREGGVRRIERAKECTACLPDRLFSHRRDGPTGRQAVVAAIL